jgi:DNA invertase Pin-like site-specific DNA recombinase
VEAWVNRQRIKRARWFEDRNSATNLQRDAFKKLQDAIFAGEIDTVVVWKLDRLARNVKEGVNVLELIGVNVACASSPSPSRSTLAAPLAI